MDKYGWFAVLVVILLITIFIGGAFLLDKMACEAKTQDMGFAHRFSVLGGCQIEVTPGQWIPLDSYYFKQE